MIFGQDTAEIERNYADQVRKDMFRLYIEMDTKNFINNGGVIQVIENGVSVNQLREDQAWAKNNTIIASRGAGSVKGAFFRIVK